MLRIKPKFDLLCPCGQTPRSLWRTEFFVTDSDWLEAAVRYRPSLMSLQSGKKFTVRK